MPSGCSAGSSWRSGGAETGYGSFVGDIPVLQALATLAWEPRRSAYFRGELFGALTMLRAGHIEQSAMVGSWAGAMGQPLFMPSSYLEYAVDIDHDGRRDIWTSIPDALGSIANYLRHFGWERGGDWGFEATMSLEVRSGLERDMQTQSARCGAMRALSVPRSPAYWAGRGVHSPEGADSPRAAGDARLLILDARTFLVYRNYEAILGYNCSHRYALSVSMLADRLRGA